MKKKISFTLMAAILSLSCLPAQAGYYKTIYVEDEKPNVIIQNIQPTETIIVEKNNYTPTYNSAAAAALGITALVGGVILGVSTHKHYKKHQPPHHNHSPKPNPPHKGKSHGHGPKPKR